MNNEELLDKIRTIVKEETVSKDEFNASRNEFNAALKPVNRRLKKIEHSIELVLKYHNEMYIAQRGRIERLEEKAGITDPHN